MIWNFFDSPMIHLASPRWMMIPLHPGSTRVFRVHSAHSSRLSLAQASTPVVLGSCPICQSSFPQGKVLDRHVDMCLNAASGGGAAPPPALTSMGSGATVRPAPHVCKVSAPIHFHTFLALTFMFHCCSSERSLAFVLISVLTLYQFHHTCSQFGSSSMTTSPSQYGPQDLETDVLQVWCQRYIIFINQVVIEHLAVRSLLSHFRPRTSGADFLFAPSSG